jgi:hypothetical protein
MRLSSRFSIEWRSGDRDRLLVAGGCTTDIGEEFVNLHGGRVEINSEIGRGTTVFIYLNRL